MSMRTRKVVLNMQKEPLMFDFISSSSFHSIYCDFLLPHQLAHSLNGTFIDPTKFLCFPVSKIHRKMELYVLQEFAIWLLLLINIPHSSLRGLSPQDRFFSEPEQIRRLSEEDIHQNFLRRRNPKL